MNSKKYCHSCGGPLTEKHIEDRLRLFCESCRKPIYENPVPATAAVVLNDKKQLLLVKRNVEPKAGEWCLPGGFLEMGESPEEGTLRELEEETGIGGEIDHWAGNVLGSNKIYEWVLVNGYKIKNHHGTLRPGDDCDEVAFFDIDTMPPIAFRSHRKIVENVLTGNLQWKRTVPLDLTQPGCFGAYVITSGDHLDLARRACNGGARVLQYRDKKCTRKQMLETAREIRDITRKSNTMFIVNDYIDIALLAGADGVHLGQDDIPVREAREITPPGFIIGVSTHSLEQALTAQEEGADYIGSGPVFATPTKEDYIPIGMETVKQVIRSVNIPVVAIGGLTPDNIDELREAGVKNFAMVRAFQTNTENVIRTINIF